MDGLDVTVLDDHSTDDTRDRVGRIAAGGSMGVHVGGGGNRGGGAARNGGIGAARGKGGALLDADDVFLPGRLATLIALGEAEGADLVADNLMLVDEGETRSRP